MAMRYEVETEIIVYLSCQNNKVTYINMLLKLNILLTSLNDIYT
jgi:hypothetical protein